MRDTPCRVFVYLASAAPIGVILRRGPTDWARLSLWDTNADRFEHGQWIKGRVFERRSDLSADGSLFAAFVRQSGGREPPGADTWIAVSRPPFFSALAVWFVGGTYHTGAFFPDRTSLWLGFQSETGPDRGSVPSWLKVAPPREIPYIDRTPEWTDRTVHFNRLLRDGWELLERDAYRTLWRRRHGVRPLVLHMMHTFEDFRLEGGPYVVEYTVWDEAACREYVVGRASWADWDQRGRLIVARDGQLLNWHLERREFEVLADFNGQAPDPQPAPDEARAWPEAPLGLG